MSVGMNRVWSLYLMLQLACNIKDIQSIRIPGNIEMLITAMYNVSNFKLFEAPYMKKKLQTHVFGRHQEIQNVIFGQGILITGSIFLLVLALLILILKRANKG